LVLFLFYLTSFVKALAKVKDWFTNVNWRKTSIFKTFRLGSDKYTNDLLFILKNHTYFLNFY